MAATTQQSERQAESKRAAARERERARLKIFGGRQGSGTCVQAAKSESLCVCAGVCVLSWQLERGRALRQVLFLFVAFVLAVVAVGVRVVVVVALASTDQALDQLLLCFDERGRKRERENARVGEGSESVRN